MLIVRINPGAVIEIVSLDTGTKEITTVTKTLGEVMAEMWLPVDTTGVFVIINDKGSVFTIWEDYLTAAGIPFVLLTDLEKL